MVPPSLRSGAHNYTSMVRSGASDTTTLHRPNHLAQAQPPSSVSQLAQFQACPCTLTPGPAPCQRGCLDGRDGGPARGPISTAMPRARTRQTRKPRCQVPGARLPAGCRAGNLRPCLLLLNVLLCWRHPQTAYFRLQEEIQSSRREKSERWFRLSIARVSESDGGSRIGRCLGRY